MAVCRRMKTLLVIDSSARANRSVTRRLTARFTEAWKARFENAEVIHRDVGTSPPRAISEAWMAAAFAQGEVGSDISILNESETFIGELFRASAVVIGVPMYNFGMPAALKAYLDQIVRVGRTFDFTGVAENPYLPLIPSKPVIVATSTGSSGYEPGGPLEALNFLEPHLAAVLGFVGLTDVTFVRTAFEESKDARWLQMIEDAEAGLDEMAGRLAVA
jgi:FMN-dependent NADH-azoreductase